MIARGGWRSGRLAAGFSVALVSAFLVQRAPVLLADAQQDRRLEAALKLFRALLSADLDLEKKSVDDRKLLVVFFHTGDGKRAAVLATDFGKRGGVAEAIRGLPLVVDTTADSRLEAYGERRPAGIFLTQAPDKKALKEIIQFGIANHVIVYSPFEGHVESGVLGGLAVEAQVRPYLNQSTLTASRISLKEFFLSVAKVYR